MTDTAELIARLKPVAERAVAALRTQLGWVALADSLNEFITAAQEAADALASLVRERDAKHAMFLYEADKHSEWLEKFMAMKAMHEAAEADAARMRKALKEAQRWITNIDNSAPVVRTIRNALGGKNE